MQLGIAMFPADFAIRPDELARAVEERGFESLFFPEHTHIPATSTTREHMSKVMGGAVGAYFSHTYDLFVALTYAATATRTLRLGTGICLVAQREPIATAKAVASLDVLSGGRILFGVGAGWIPEEAQNHGIDPARRWAVMDERVKAMRDIWTQDEVVEHHGRYVQFGPLSSWPKPRQKPRPPVLVGGAGPGAERRVLDYGDEWMPHAGIPVHTLSARIASLRQAARAAGKIDVPITLFGADPDAAALKELRASGVDRAVLYAPPADANTVLRFLDQVALLRSAVSD